MIEVKDLQKKYDGKMVLDVESFTFQDGLRYALIGANGSGKSTLLRLIANVEKQTHGDISTPKAQQIGYMPQHSYGFSMSVLNNMLLASPASMRKEAKADALLLLSRLKLSALKRKNAARLSGGETERLALARLFLAKHEILLLDEPTASMDVASTSISEEAILEYADDNDVTLIFATHSLKQAERLADEVLFLADGKIVEHGKPDELFSNPKSDLLKEFLQKS